MLLYCYKAGEVEVIVVGLSILMLKYFSYCYDSFLLLVAFLKVWENFLAWGSKYYTSVGYISI